MNSNDLASTNYAPPNDMEGDLDNNQVDRSLPSVSFDERLEIVQSSNDSSLGNPMSTTGA